jgi:hypothetical protein
MQGDDIKDAPGGIANAIAGSARRHFGRKMEISMPAALKETEPGALGKSGALPIPREQPMMTDIR